MHNQCAKWHFVRVMRGFVGLGDKFRLLLRKNVHTNDESLMTARNTWSPRQIARFTLGESGVNQGPSCPDPSTALSERGGHFASCGLHTYRKSAIVYPG